MDQRPLVEQIEAGVNFINRFDKTIPVKVAFWLKPTEADQWYLYIASDRIDDEDLNPGYREVLRLAQENPNPYLSPFQVKLISSDSTLARAALEIKNRFPGPINIPISAGAFGGMGLESALIYSNLVIRAAS